MNAVKKPSGRSKWPFRIGVLAVVGSVILLVLWLTLFSLPPSEWMKLEVGDHRAKIVKDVGSPDSDMRDVKGYELWKSENTKFLAATGYWQMLLTYDSSASLSSRSVHFIPYESGGYNEWIPGKFLYRIKEAYSSQMP